MPAKRLHAEATIQGAAARRMGDQEAPGDQDGPDSGELRVFKLDGPAFAPPDYALIYLNGQIPTDAWVWTRAMWDATPEGYRPPKDQVAVAGDVFLWLVTRGKPYGRPWEGDEGRS